MRRYDLGGVRDIAPLGERAEIVLKALQMIFNEWKGR
jgi:hypothetical protein